jgi:8-oxo-dGTP pyrophosphatase MutT (NUDIX family)
MWPHWSTPFTNSVRPITADACEWCSLDPAARAPGYVIRSSGAVITHCFAGKWRYLLLRVYSYWDFPKGVVEKGENSLAAACREISEETSLNDLDFPWGTEYRETAPYRHGKIARYYLCRSRTAAVSLPVNPEIGRPEHDEYRWLSYNGCRKLLVPRLIPVIEWAHALTGDHCEAD